MNSFQDSVKAKIPAEIKPGIDGGRAIAASGESKIEVGTRYAGLIATPAAIRNSG
jgi:hypothetical protein